MMPPTSIDGTDITGATIDGQDVQEITVDGQTVFSAGPSNLPVAYSNLVAWYPFDSATYGDSNADDVTSILGGSGDDTAYNGTVNGATYQASGGVTDINAGANSGAFDFSGDDIETNLFQSDLNEISISAWIKQDTANDNNYRSIMSGERFQEGLWIWRSGTSNGIAMCVNDNGTVHRTLNDFNEQVGVWRHVVGVTDGTANDLEVYVDNVELSSSTDTEDPRTPSNYAIGKMTGSFGKIEPFDGIIEDVRVYNKRLSTSEINQIYQNTQP